MTRAGETGAAAGGRRPDRHPRGATVKTIKNKTTRPLKVTFSRGKVLHLGPGKSGQIPDPAVEEKSIRALVESGAIEILEGGGPAYAGGEGGGAPHPSTRGKRGPLQGPSGDR
jgi:hypothetical protein